MVIVVVVDIYRHWDRRAVELSTDFFGNRTFLVEEKP
jgi:hypothetical protein